MRSCGRFALLCLDLDRFKALNDRHGHVTGDEFLRRVAAGLTKCVRDADTVARIGGDEFALILADIERTSDTHRILDKLLVSVREAVALGAHGVSVSASIGASVYPDDGDDTATLIAHADSAMYAVKAAGGNGYHVFTR
jgi:diguanylate cyclase (GGDEF)-like protein